MVTGAAGDRVTGDKVMADLRVLAADMEELLKATAGQTGHQVAQVRARAEESLAAVKARVAVLQQSALAHTRVVGRATDEYVHANPGKSWPSAPRSVSCSASCSRAAGLPTRSA
jgi:ElaB/YqjD/DUF883 family membrane-anchored ribosome-binding protein